MSFVWAQTRRVRYLSVWADIRHTWAPATIFFRGVVKDLLSVMRQATCLIDNTQRSWKKWRIFRATTMLCARNSYRRRCRLSVYPSEVILADWYCVETTERKRMVLGLTQRLYFFRTAALSHHPYILPTPSDLTRSLWGPERADYMR